MMAVWGLTGLSKPMIPMHEPVYDLRVLVSSLKATLGIDEITPQTLEVIMQSSPPMPALLSFINGLPMPIA
jgi:oleate hydratase